MSVSGRLKDLGQVVANQTIRLVSSNETFEARTDADGNYRFEGVADGKYLLVYGNKQASVSVKGGQVSIAELAEVVVVAANDTQTVEQVSKTVNVISGQEMRDRADFSLIESLRTIPGFSRSAAWWIWPLGDDQDSRTEESGHGPPGRRYQVSRCDGDHG